jgi:phospholipid/cholesterol/gamma-HCH transport system substrate-binding protein
MATRAQKLRLGVFLAAVIALMLGTLALVIGRQVLGERPEYVIRVRESVNGLDRGSPVKLRGVRVGSIERIQIDPDNVEVVELFISVDPNTPIKVDHQAVMSMQGITGLKFIELIGGTREAPRLPPGGEIKAGQTMLDQLTGDVADISRQIAKLLTQLLALTRPENRKRIDALLANTNTLFEHLDQLVMESQGTLKTARQIMGENRGPLRHILMDLERSASHFDRTLTGLDQAVASARTAIDEAKLAETSAELRRTGETVSNTLNNLELQAAVNALVGTLTSMQRVLHSTETTLAQNQEAIKATLDNLRRASSSMKETARTFQEKPMIQLFGDQPQERKLP